MNRLFGTNGIRWLPDKVKESNFAIELGLSFGRYFGEGKTVCLGIDSRTTGPMIASAVSSGIMAAGCNIIDLGLVPTPTVQFAVIDLRADGGIVISASHNPPEYNGIKCIAGDGTELMRQGEEEIERTYSQREFDFSDWQNVGTSISDNTIRERHINKVRSYVKLNDSQKKVKVVVDCANGTAGLFTPNILTRMGCEVITLNAQPDGLFPGRLSEPLEVNLEDLKRLVKETGADLGVAHDGDADRAIFIDEKGQYVSGDKSLAIFAEEALSVRKGGTIVIPVNASKTVSDTIEGNGGVVDLSPIGSPLIARRMLEKGAILGGEGNGGMIFPDHMFCRDGMMTAVKMVELIKEKGDLSGLVGSLPDYHLQRTKISCPNDLKSRVIEQLKNTISEPTINIDGIKIIEDDWWVLMRPSGTEPGFRVTTEARDSHKGKAKLEEYEKMVKEIINSLTS